jgi:hypothetical protein
MSTMQRQLLNVRRGAGDTSTNFDTGRKPRSHHHLIERSPILIAGQQEFTAVGQSASRRELLTQLQQTHGNAFVQRFIGDQIIAARGHNSPPATGPGSHGDPLVGRRAVQLVSGLSTDAYFRSPVNPTNPVLVWTDGVTLFFAPSQAQITAGRAVAMPEPSFVPLPGYRAEEVHWDRREGLVTGGGPLVIIARKIGEPDLEIAVSNTLEQKSFFSGGAAGVSSGGLLHVSRLGGEFLRVDDTTVPLEVSGAAAPGPIHAITFADGFFRYRAPGGSHDLYVAQGAAPFAHLVERASGNITRTFASGTIDAIVPEPGGVVHLEQTATVSGSASQATATIDLRASPPLVTSATGHASAETGYASAKARLVALGVSIQENGVRFQVAELETIETALSLGSNRGLTALLSFRTLERLGPTDPILEISKSIGPDDARGQASAGMGTPTLSASEPFEASAIERTSTIRHEMTHVVMGAIDAVSRASLTSLQRADLEGAMRFAARRAQQKARAGLLRASEYGAADVVPPPGAFRDWRSRVGDDEELASVWVELLRRYRFIPDPEGTREFRGTALADESRYSGAGEVSVGHPDTSVGEFVASFVASATLFRTQFVAAVLAAEAAAIALGGGGGTYLRRLYRRAWHLIDAKYVPLGPNPF